MSLLNYKFFTTIRRWMFGEEAADTTNPRYRIEVRRLPADIFKQAVAFEMVCVGHEERGEKILIHPFRARDERGGVYFRSTCSINCRNGGAARREYKRIIAALPPENIKRLADERRPRNKPYATDPQDTTLPLFAKPPKKD